MESVAQDILRKILLNLPTKDVVRCRCVSRRWHGIVCDPSFNAAHVVVVSGRSEALLVSQKTTRDRRLVTNVFSVSSAHPSPMCSFMGLAEGYRPVNVCNGLLLLASGVEGESLLLCNPVTGEELRIPAPPPPPETGYLRLHGRHCFAMGLSIAPTHQYKIFRIPLDELSASVRSNYLEVYTLGGDCMWRRHTDLFRDYKTYWAGSAPVLIDGKLYLLIKGPKEIIVIDVATEMHGTYGLMPGVYGNAAMDVLEMGGRPYIAVQVIDQNYVEFQLWAMPQPRVVRRKGQSRMHKKPPGYWQLRYKFLCGRPLVDNSLYDDPRAVWVDGDGMLCCVMGYHLYKYDTANGNELGELLDWDHQLSLPNGGKHPWSIYGGYRPCLLSLRDLDGPQDEMEEKEEQLEQALLHALRMTPQDHQKIMAVTTSNHTTS